MTKKNRNNKKLKLALAIVLIISVVAMLTGGIPLLKSSNDNSPVSQSDPDAANTSNSINKAIFYGAVYSQDGYDALLVNEAQKVNDNANITELPSDSVNWEAEKVIPVKFFTSPGQSVQSLAVNDDGEISVTLLSAPGGCMYPQVQNRQLAFAVASKTQAIKSTNTIQFVVIENDVSCAN